MPWWTASSGRLRPEQRQAVDTVLEWKGTLGEPATRSGGKVHAFVIRTLVVQ